VIDAGRSDWNCGGDFAHRSRVVPTLSKKFDCDLKNHFSSSGHPFTWIRWHCCSLRFHGDHPAVHGFSPMGGPSALPLYQSEIKRNAQNQQPSTENIIRANDSNVSGQPRYLGTAS
jgi:hypothetical protein